MSEFSSERLDALLRAAESRALTEAERAMLKELLATDEGQLVVSVHQHLREHYVPSGRDAYWSAEELQAISAEISTALPQQRQRRRFTTITQQIGFAALAIAVIVGFILSWPLLNQNAVEPVAQPTPTATTTPQPTATLLRNYLYASLLDEEVTTTTFFEDEQYTQSLESVLAQWDGNLYLPQQMMTTMSFKGARLNEAEDVLELAFVLNGASDDTWLILAQSSAENRELTPPLPVDYQPLPRIDETLVYDDEAIQVGELPAYAYQFEAVYSDETVANTSGKEWVVYNTVTWQYEGQLFTLYWIHTTLVPSRTTATIANNFQLSRVDDR